MKLEVKNSLAGCPSHVDTKVEPIWPEPGKNVIAGNVYGG
jgi:hypothetical protein